MSNENRSHKQQHCLRGKGAGHNIMVRIVANYYSKKKTNRGTVSNLYSEGQLCLDTFLINQSNYFV